MQLRVAGTNSKSNVPEPLSPGLVLSPTPAWYISLIAVLLGPIICVTMCMTIICHILTLWHSKLSVNIPGVGSCPHTGS
jgi:hypothetical protein